MLVSAFELYTAEGALYLCRGGRDALLIITASANVFVLSWLEDVQNFQLAMTFPLIEAQPQVQNHERPQQVDKPLVADIDLVHIDALTGKLAKLLMIHAHIGILQYVTISWTNSGRIESADIQGGLDPGPSGKAECRRLAAQLHAEL